MFLGIFFVLLGISIIIKVLFKIDLPIFRMMIAVFFIFLGIKMLTGVRLWSWSTPWGDSGANTVVLGSGQMRSDMNSIRNQFKTVFGSSLIDLTELPLATTSETRRVEIDSVFSETRVLLNPNIPVRIHAQSVFAEAKMPDGNMVAFGSLNYKSGDSPKLEIRADAVFGSLRFENVEKPAAAAAPPPAESNATHDSQKPQSGDDDDKD